MTFFALTSKISINLQGLKAIFRLKQSPESLPESHERMLQYLVTSPYSSRWNKATITVYKDRRADLDETFIKAFVFDMPVSPINRKF